MYCKKIYEFGLIVLKIIEGRKDQMWPIFHLGGNFLEK